MFYLYFFLLKSCKSLKPHFKYRLRLDFCKCIIINQHFPCSFDISRFLDFLHYAVRIIQRNNKSFKNMLSFFCFSQLKFCFSSDNSSSVIDEMCYQLPYIENFWFIINESKHYHPKRCLKPCVLVKLVENNL